VDIPPNDLRSVFGRVMKGLHHASGEFLATVETELLKTYVRWPSGDDVRRACEERPFYRGKQKEEFFILRRIAEAVEGREYPHIRLGTGAGNYSIEHILPQGSLTEDWIAELQLGDDGMDSVRIWQDRKDVVGNLTLTAYNSRLSNRPFTEKKSFIDANLRLELSRQILEAEHWTKTEIDSRSRALGELAVTIWARPTD
jgi:hypothetical protein